MKGKEGGPASPVYQLQSAKQGSTTKESYTYDLVGNRLTSLGVSQYNYNSSNELTSTPSGNYTYDNNGNRKSDPGGAQYSWDFENRLTQVILPGTGGTVTFKYDSFGRRAQKAFTQNGTTTTTNYLYDGSNVVETVDQSGNLLSRYVETLSIDEPLQETVSGTTSYYEQDGVGSVTSLSNASATLVNTYGYDSYGRATGSTGTIANPFRYTGREFDSETSDYYFRARYYDQSVGRFISEDPDQFDASVNFYPYVDNDPEDWTDPMGRDKVQVCCRPVRKAKPFLMIWHHCYIKISGSDGTHTWGILPAEGGIQIPVKDNPRNSGGKCKDAPGVPCQVDKLKRGLDNDVNSGTCPSCGANYHNSWWRFAGYNSNTFVYNMVSGAGLTPPPEPLSPGYNPAPGAWYP